MAATAMEHRTFGRTGWNVTSVGVGTWAIGGAWGEPDDEVSVAALHAALDDGINVIDTANIYSDAGTVGRSERLIGRVLKERKDAGKSGRVFVLTKAGRQGTHSPANYTYEALKAEAQGSLERLGVDALDLLQLHCPPREVLDAGAAFAALQRIRDEDKLIREWGVSVETEEEALLCIAQPGCAAVQIIINAFRAKPLGKVLAAARDAGTALLARVPLASGLLTGKVDAAFVASLPPSDHRVFNRLGESFDAGETWSGLGAHLDTAIEAVDGVREAYAAYIARINASSASAATDGSADPSTDGPADPTLAQFALRWILDAAGSDSPVVVIPGVRSVAQSRANAAAGRAPPLSADEVAAVRAVYDAKIGPLIHSKW